MPISVLTRDDFKPQPHGKAAAALAKKVPVAADVFAKLYRRLDTAGFEEHLGNALAQAGMIGVATATPASEK